MLSFIDTFDIINIGGITMLYIIKIIFFLLGMMIHLLHSFTIYSCIYILLILGLLCIFELLPKNYHPILLYGYLLLCVFLPYLLCYLPFTILYLSYKDIHHILIYIFIFLIITFHMIFTKQSFPLLILCWTIIAHYTMYVYHHNDKLYRQLKKQRDILQEQLQNTKTSYTTLQEEQAYEIYLATLKERNRIAKDFHDHIGHVLSSALIQSGAIHVMNHDEMLDQALLQLQDTLRTGMEQARKSIHHLYDTSLNFEDEIQKILTQYSTLPVHYHNALQSELSPTICLQFIALIKESLHNVQKHANPSYINIKIKEHPSFYQLIICNDGVLYPMQEHGMGLESMKSRVHQMQGFISIECNHIFQLFITIPKKKGETL